MPRISSHQWTGWWRHWPDKRSGAPEYGPCETLVKEIPCGQPRHEHDNIAQARHFEEEA